MPEEPDCALLRRFVAGEQDAFEALFRQFQPEVYRWILYILRDANHTKDVVIETFWRAYRGRVDRVFRRLKPDLQVVAILALIEERPYAEIADALDVRLGTVKSRLSRGVKKMREELLHLGIQP